MEEPTKMENNGRDEKGRFLKGTIGNPEGRPHKISITRLVEKELEKCPEGSEKTYAELFINKLFKKAVTDGDFNTMKLIWNYIEGLPTGDVNINLKDKRNIDFSKYTEDELQSLIELAKRNEPEIGTITKASS